MLTLTHSCRLFREVEALITPSNLTKNRIVVDTDVFSYTFKGDTRAEFFRPFFMHRTLSLSFVTVGQLYYGAYKDGWGETRITRLENQIKNYVVLPWDYLICQQWARIRSECEIKGHSMEDSDIWIAACARHYDCALATNNGRHFRHIDNLTIICPGMF